METKLTPDSLNDLFNLQSRLLLSSLLLKPFGEEWNCYVFLTMINHFVSRDKNVGDSIISLLCFGLESLFFFQVL